MNEPLKFIHASDLHLDRPFSGVAEAPPHIRKALIDAAYTAAENIFDRAISEKVDFLLLAGDVADIDRCGPRGISFLVDQFRRLDEKNIHVYWAGGETDQLERWPNMLSAPDNVHLFTSTLVEEYRHRRGGRIVASILGAGYDRRKRRIAEFRAEESEAFPIGLCYGNLESDEISRTGIRYWALGGNPIRRTFTRDDAMLAFPGTSQSRGPHQADAHGSTLVSVDEEGCISTYQLATDAVRWVTQRIRIGSGMSQEEIRSRFEDIAYGLAAETDGQLLLVDWQVSAEGAMNGKLHTNQWLSETESWLRNEFGQPGGSLWTLGITLANPRSLPQDWYEEDTMLGDYLRSVREHQQETADKLNLSRFVDADSSEEELVTAVQMDADQRREMLRASAMMGVRLLSGTEEN
ncbi:MAG: metallophosphoesterase [Planctomycetota bacterium]|nr:metallophosphoesterase [Planctomycetota bacterium]